MSFSEKAASWDTPQRIERAKLVADEIRRTVGLRRNWNALEFGSGTGLVGFNLTGELHSITMLDTSEGMIAEARRKAETGGVSNVTAINADIGTLVGKNTFDFIYSSMALHHVPDVKGMTSTFRRLLNPGGVLCVVDLDTVSPAFHENEAGFDGHHGFDQKELCGTLTSCGFTGCESHTFLRDRKEGKVESVEYSLFIMTGTA